MIVRIASVQVPPERIDEMVSHYRETLRPVHEKCEGLSGVNPIFRLSLVFGAAKRHQAAPRTR